MYKDGIRELTNRWSNGFAVAVAKISTPLPVLIVLLIAVRNGVTMILIEVTIAINNAQIAVSGGLYSL